MAELHVLNNEYTCDTLIDNLSLAKKALNGRVHINICESQQIDKGETKKETGRPLSFSVCDEFLARWRLTAFAISLRRQTSTLRVASAQLVNAS